MKTIADILRRLLTADGVGTHPSAAAVVEPVEGRVLMSVTLLPLSLSGGGDGSMKAVPTDQVSINYTKIRL